MPTVDLLSFSDALSDATMWSARNVLLGNGFSIESQPALAYTRLADVAEELPDTPITPELREIVGSPDFEVMARHLEVASRLAELYEPGAGRLPGFLREQSARVRLSLVDALAQVIPDYVEDISDDAYRHARAFLNHFGSVFTLSYDPLLYWVVNRVMPSSPCPSTDGFSGYPDLTFREQDARAVHFLHGALHLFISRDGHRTVKVRGRDGRIVVQARRRIGDGEYPLVVTEGDSATKLARIQSNSYLRAGLTALQQLTGALFVHGASMDERDRHIFDHVAAPQSLVAALYVSVHGEQTSRSNREMIDYALSLKDKRRTCPLPLTVQFYDAQTANAWGESSDA